MLGGDGIYSEKCHKDICLSLNSDILINMLMWIKEKLPRVKRNLMPPQVPMIVSASRNIVIMAFYVNCFFITGKYII